MTKYLLLIAAAAFLYVNSVHGQDFKPTIEKTFMAFDTTQNVQQKVDQSNRLTMIAKKWDSEWAAHYYAAYSKVILSYDEKDEAKRDAYLDDADNELENAVSKLGKNNDETYVLTAMVANARLAVKPQARWQKYGKIFDENMAKAKELNANNPRIYFLQGMSKFHTPKMFGGGKKSAQPYFEKAAGLYANEQSNDIEKPYWGKHVNAYFLGQCKGDD